MDTLIFIDVLILMVLFAFSSVFSASETALMALGRVRLANAIERGGKRGEALERWREDPNRLLTTLLIMNNAVNIAASTVAAFLAIRLAEHFGLHRGQLGALLAALVTVVIIVFGEVSPKLLAIRQAEPIALFVIRPLIGLDKLLQPIGRVLVFIANLVMRLLGQKPGTYVPVITDEEIQTVIKLGADAGVIEDQEHQMLHGIIQMRETQVREVMVPRMAMECINADDDMDRIIDQIIQTGYSRMPVYRDHFDNIIGVIYTKDIISILQNRELIVLQDILRQPYFVPQTKKVDELLREFQKGKIHMAIVVDEYGGTSGLVTLEDLIEEIVGEIHDEYDTEERMIEKVDDHTWLVSGQADVQDINQALEVELPNLQDLNTIGGVITERLGHLPRKGEMITYEGLVLTVVASSSRRVEKVQIHKPPVPPADEG